MIKSYYLLAALVAPLALVGASGTVHAADAYVAALTGDEEVPAVDTTATGSGSITCNDDGTISYTVNVSGLSGPATASHIHKGASGTAGPVVIPFTINPGVSTGVLASGTIAADAAGTVCDDLAAGMGFYVNVHTAANPGGEVRGQLESPPPAL